jgi:hypothetical protein
MKMSGKLQGKWLSQLLFTCSLVFLAFGLFNLGWYVWPSPTDGVQLTIPAGILKGAPGGTNYASLADYSLSLSWPRWLRIQQKGKLQVILIESEDRAANAALARPAQVVLIEPVLVGLAVNPPGRMQTSMADGQSLEMSWELIGQSRGAYPGKVVVSFGFFDQLSNELVAVPVAVVDVSLQIVSLWDDQPQMALWMGGIGLVLWGALFVLGRLVQVRK